MANPYAAIKAYQTPGRIREKAITASEKTRVGARGVRSDMKEDFKKKAKAASDRAKKALEKAKKKSKLRGKFGKLAGKVAKIFGGKVAGEVVEKGLGAHNAWKTAKQAKHYLKSAGKIGGYEDTFLSEHALSANKALESQWKSIDPKEAAKASLESSLAGSLGDALGNFTKDKLGDWAGNKFNTKLGELEISDKVMEKIEQIDLKSDTLEAMKFGKLEEGSAAYEDFKEKTKDLSKDEVLAFKKNLDEKIQRNVNPNIDESYFDELNKSRSFQDIDKEWGLSKKSGGKYFNTDWSPQSVKEQWQSMKTPFTKEGLYNIGTTPIDRGLPFQEAEALDFYRPFLDDLGSNQAYEIGVGQDFGKGQGGYFNLLEQLQRNQNLPSNTSEAAYGTWGMSGMGTSY